MRRTLTKFRDSTSSFFTMMWTCPGGASILANPATSGPASTSTKEPVLTKASRPSYTRFGEGANLFLKTRSFHTRPSSSSSDPTRASTRMTTTLVVRLSGILGRPFSPSSSRRCSLRPYLSRFLRIFTSTRFSGVLTSLYRYTLVTGNIPSPVFGPTQTPWLSNTL
jgi:hypothetical protein